MGGWSLVYNLINFAILIAALYFIGKKIVLQAYQNHRNTIRNDLEKSAASLENVKTLHAQKEAAEAAGEKERAGILADAGKLAEDNSRKSECEDERSAAHLKGEAQKELDHAAIRLRRELREQAAEEIAGAAGELIENEENAAALVLSITAFGTAIAQGLTASHAMDAIARQPEAAGDIRGSLILSLALMEALTIYGMLVAFMLVGKI